MTPSKGDVLHVDVVGEAFLLLEENGRFVDEVRQVFSVFQVTARVANRRGRAERSRGVLLAAPNALRRAAVRAAGGR